MKSIFAVELYGQTSVSFFPHTLVAIVIGFFYHNLTSEIFVTYEMTEIEVINLVRK